MSEDKRSVAGKTKLSAQEQRRRWQERLMALRLRITIGRALEERGILDAGAIGAALGMPPAEAAKLLGRRQWREGDAARLAAAATHFGLPGCDTPT